MRLETSSSSPSIPLRSSSQPHKQTFRNLLQSSSIISKKTRAPKRTPLKKHLTKPLLFSSFLRHFELLVPPISVTSAITADALCYLMFSISLNRKYCSRQQYAHSWFILSYRIVSHTLITLFTNDVPRI